MAARQRIAPKPVLHVQDDDEEDDDEEDEEEKPAPQASKKRKAEVGCWASSLSAAASVLVQSCTLLPNNLA
jgi:hypothetical protein